MGSRPATQDVTIYNYSKLIRLPDSGRQTEKWINFGDLTWEVTVRPMNFNEETGVPDYLIVGVQVGIAYSFESARGTDISIEILDRTGEHTVFHHESGTTYGSVLLVVRRSELEASSCIDVKDDSFLVRCTLKEQQRPSLLGDLFDLFSSKSKKHKVPEVAMTTSHALTVHSLSKIKATLLPMECAHSTHFAVGGSRWYLQLYPTPAVVRLVRATNDKTVTRAEFSFALEGAVNVQSGMMAHTFHRDSPDCAFQYQPPDEPSTSSTDGLVIRCCVTVIPDAVVPTATTVPRPPAAVIPADVPPPDESVLTPLLSAMHGDR
ncbi:unnamed protein product [Alopecurus aequalis]